MTQGLRVGIPPKTGLGDRRQSRDERREHKELEQRLWFSQGVPVQRRGYSLYNFTRINRGRVAATISSIPA